LNIFISRSFFKQRQYQTFFQPASKVVTAVTEIKYVDFTGKFEFQPGKVIEIKYTIQVR
jgi:hypothetical protein